MRSVLREIQASRLIPASRLLWTMGVAQPPGPSGQIRRLQGLPAEIVKPASQNDHSDGVSRSPPDRESDEIRQCRRIPRYVT